MLEKSFARRLLQIPTSVAVRLQAQSARLPSCHGFSAETDTEIFEEKLRRMFFSETTAWQKGDFHAWREMWDPDLWPRRVWLCGRRKEAAWEAHSSRSTYVGLVVGLDWVNDSIQAFLVHGTGKSKMAHCHLIPAQPFFPRPNTAGAPGKWDRNITLPFSTEECGTALMGFAGSARQRPVCRVFLLKQECRLVNWLVLIRLVQFPVTAAPPQRSQTASVWTCT